MSQTPNHPSGTFNYGQSQVPQYTNRPPQQVQWIPPKNQNKKSHTILWIVLSVVGALVLICGIGGAVMVGGAAKVSSNIQKADAQAQNDVSLTTCTTDVIGLKAVVKATNSSKKPASYMVTVVFENGSTQVGTGVALLNDVQAGSTMESDAVALGVNTTTKFTCKITKVDRI